MKRQTIIIKKNIISNDGRFDGRNAGVRNGFVTPVRRLATSFRRRSVHRADRLIQYHRIFQAVRLTFDVLELLRREITQNERQDNM